MARKQHGQAGAWKAGPVICVVLFCGLFAAAGVGYLWQKDQIRVLGDEMKKREQRSSYLHAQNDKLRRQMDELRTPARLEMKARDLNLGLVPPQPTQVLSLHEPASEARSVETETAQGLPPTVATGMPAWQ
jgi:hypothetical protein